MDSQHFQQQHEDSSSSTSSKNSFLCRQSSTRWIPTTDQIRILKDLYYNNGVRSPSAEQIQRISSRLRQYGKIEGKNVFYWFQNHKARERQKKRFTVDMAMQRGGWKSEDSVNMYTNMAAGFSSACSSSAGVLSIGQMGGISCGSVLMEKSFRDCNISGGGGYVNNTLGWVGTESPPSSYDSRFDMRKPNEMFMRPASPDVETLQLFPIHGDDANKPEQEDYFQGWNFDDAGEGRDSWPTSLELSLSSFGASEPDSSTC